MITYKTAVLRKFALLATDFDGTLQLSEGGQPADLLMEVTVPIITQRKCRRDTRYRASEITENMMCAGYDEGVLDACQVVKQRWLVDILKSLIIPIQIK